MIDQAGAHTFGDVLRANAAARPDKAAFEMLDGEAVNFGDLNRRVNALNNAFAELGACKGARVALLAKNRLEYVEVYGLSKSGLIVVPLNWRLAPGELVNLIRHSAPEVLVVDEHHRLLAESIRNQIPSVKHFVLIGGTAGGWQGYEDLIQRASDAEPVSQALPDDVLCLIYTSGTTGAPKGVAMTHAGVMGNCAAAAQELKLTDADITMAVMPLFHAGGMWYHLFPSFASGTTSLLLSDFDPATILRELQVRRITNVHLAPTMIAALLSNPSAASADLGSVRVLFYAASSMPPELLRRAMQTFPRCGFVQGYGSTEAGVVTILRADAHRRAMEPGGEYLLASCGLPYPGRLVRVVDDAGVELPQGEVGEVEVHSPDLMQGYWLDDQATVRALHGKWLKTGDLGRLDLQGFLYIVDRKNDMVVTGGENVFPTEVESYLYRDQDVEEAAVFGIPDPAWVERVVAAVVLRPGSTATGEELVRRLRTQLAGYKCPKEIFVVNHLPKSAVGKVLRKELRRRFGEEPQKERGAQ
ncbi:AMP-binding protein [Variovorax paradoxus]|uniref:AMP-binding protein n=1 Tax=Variovorax paradoxus TaxID=34073 RepID=A0A5Q0M6P9_VARPD|nr:AMP-binding protein [Variovorax paradoxus]QFZ85126.1 AMP-binding protein [Variovorax paradoxus]